MNQEEEQKKVSNWDYYISPFLKAASVESPEDEYKITRIEETLRDGEKILRLYLLIRNDIWLFDLNKTNLKFLKDSEPIVSHPSMLVGRKICFRIEPARNPTTGQTVDSLRISKVI